MASVTATAVASAATSSGPSSKGLSIGTIAAIAVVAGIVVIAALVGLFIWWKRRAGQGRGEKRLDAPSMSDKAYAHAGELETLANVPELEHRQTRAELGGRDRAELGGLGRVELE